LNRKIFSPVICYKGKRNYLHGTDISDCLIRTIKKYDSLSIKFLRVISTNLDFYFVNQNELKKFRLQNTISVLLNYTYKGESLFLAGLENKLKVNCNVKDYEKQIINSSTLNSSEVSSINHGNGTLVDKIVVMNKFLLSSLFENNNWLFTQLDLYCPFPEKIHEIKIKYNDSLGTMLYKSSIFFNKVEIGSIMFSKVQGE